MNQNINKHRNTKSKATKQVGKIILKGENVTLVRSIK